MAGRLCALRKIPSKSFFSTTHQIHYGLNKNILSAFSFPLNKISLNRDVTYNCNTNIHWETILACNVHLRWFKTSVVFYEEKDVIVPEFPESVAEGDVRWNKKVGESVIADEVVCEIETDKTAIPVPSPGNGVIVARYADDGGTIKAHQKIFRIKFGPASSPPAKAASTPAREARPQPKAASTPAREARPQPKAEMDPPKVSPLSKSIPSFAPKQIPPLAVPLIKVSPKDPTREIAGTRSEFRVKMNRMRQRIAQRLKDAQNVNAMLTTFNEIDMSSIITFRKTHQEAFTKKHGIKLGFMSAFVKGAAYALQDQPVVNGFIDGNEIVYRDYIDISVAIATPKGLVVPVIRNVTYMNFADIEKSISVLGEKARNGRLAIEDMDGGTFTISNGGVFGSLMGTPIINPPQSAILGMHATVDRPVAFKGQIIIKPMMYVALTYDHRLIDGREAVLFLRKIKDAVESPTIMVAGM